MEDLFYYVLSIILYFFYLSLSIKLLNYIISSIFFVLPMEKEYKILKDNLYSANHFPSRYDLCLICTILIIFMLLLVKILSIWLFIFTLFIILITSFIFYNRYIKYNILNYINLYSEDLFDWHKIYDLDIIDETIKKECFAIHNINYEDFKFEHLMYLRIKRFDIQSKIDKIGICPFCKEKTKVEWNFCNYCGNKLK